ncbi:NAD(P)/FAD-dependent oxidoreductase [Mycobacterium sp. TY815]|uniref:flavin-containing monooxygenase n=1 Tax=Mycobacterium sp. TY815 TaxID=3050581 RepID=UPI0027404D51|nr:NAD(P)/FAD-dependent oxidoreductase [Mycobacterium sp. TY815]MDP7703632.1 NAD(P)/FAD-dependent oxidoreductase [Mycobacterium sp. TY815]
MTEHLDVIILGAGISGISAAWHLQNQCPGKTYAILEQRDRLGGTWDLFRYPGVRADTDMYTLGFHFQPWAGRAIAGGEPIRDYLGHTAAEWGIDKRIRFNHRVIRADWRSAESRWVLRAEQVNTGSRIASSVTISCSFLIVCTGYYSHEQGHSPNFPGSQAFRGPIIHPQHWPAELDYAGKRVVVVGSGATAVTLVPALADSGAKHVTMLQRSATYVVAEPERDVVADMLNRRLPQGAAYAAVRWKNILRQAALYRACRRWPQRMRARLIKQARRQLPQGYDVEKHFGPQYNPWDQRLCVAPNGDLFRTIRQGRTEVVTDTVSRFTATGILLDSGRELPADIIVTATGLNLQLFGGTTVSIDGRPVDLARTMTYKGAMLSGVPNLAFAFGYTNASWTLRVELVSEFICRLLTHMDTDGLTTVVAEHPGAGVEERPFIEDFTPGYVLRVLDWMPRQGSRSPWRVTHSYLRDLRLIRHGKIADDWLRFSTNRPDVPAAPNVPLAPAG